MKILLIGGGGREHALARSIADSPLVTDLRIAPGNPGMEGLGTLIQIKADDYDALFDYAVNEAVDLVVIGPEAPLVAGLADRLQDAGIRAFGPSAAAAQLEGSKEFARDFCTRHNIPQPAFFAAQDKDSAYRHIDAMNGFCVVKADGLAAGKGVVVADTADEAKAAVDAMLGGQFGDASKTILIEERITGPEASLFALLDGGDALYMASAQDHKRAYDGDKGPNTGGMGAISPSPRLDDALIEQVMDQVVRPLARGMADEGIPYQGVLYVGLMLTATGPQVIEFNCRFGDPEAQVILPRLKTDIITAMLAATDGGLGHFDMRWDDANAVTVVMATKGYPGAYDKGSAINNSESDDPDCIIFHAGTARDEHGQLIATGGRVLAVTGMGDNAAIARQKAYEAVAKIDWPEGFYRSDIAADS
ncbi:phosphoribosylamine--glycine ligase [Candidatus Puniceispirillum marinum]|uniref:Phosphoribosylamine--glycine ligase n=1 Tax=Puniceispirillum marinum (strain IMCC1322) TaxID=488538 RepID=D5BSY3_PUNMI|nr:phosphoribosylamine--glycine ligase [Candidatus Puniceispirillum marinum]ADE39380.1 phosphoribosylamine--glycine ligase [Candidatus Puniceispirillum marinum IMCC1322]